MKKIALAATAMGGTALIAFGASGTFAAFSDTSTVGNGAGAGTLTLTTASSSVTTGVDYLELAPGQSNSYAYYARNGGNMAGTITAALTVTDRENNCLAPEQRQGDTTCGADQGEFSHFADVELFYVHGAKAATCTPTTTKSRTSVFEGSLDDLRTYAVPSDVLQPNQGHCVILEVALPDDPDINQVQGDASTFNVTFTLEQFTGTRAPIKLDPGTDPNTPIDDTELELPGEPFVPGGGSV